MPESTRLPPEPTDPPPVTHDPEAPKLSPAPHIVVDAVYALTRFWALDPYPITFFTDAAVPPHLAARLLADGLRDHAGTFLPPYFQDDDRWNLSPSVYLHLIPVALFGNSVIVARATSAAVSLFGALAIALALRAGFQSRVWWSAVLVLR